MQHHCVFRCLLHCRFGLRTSSWGCDCPKTLMHSKLSCCFFVIDALRWQEFSVVSPVRADVALRRPFTSVTFEDLHECCHTVGFPQFFPLNVSSYWHLCLSIADTLFFVEASDGSMLDFIFTCLTFYWSHSWEWSSAVKQLHSISSDRRANYSLFLHSVICWQMNRGTLLALFSSQHPTETLSGL